MTDQKVFFMTVGTEMQDTDITNNKAAKIQQNKLHKAVCYILPFICFLYKINRRQGMHPV